MKRTGDIGSLGGSALRDVLNGNFISPELVALQKIRWETEAQFGGEGLLEKGTIVSVQGPWAYERGPELLSGDAALYKLINPEANFHTGFSATGEIRSISIIAAEGHRGIDETDNGFVICAELRATHVMGRHDLRTTVFVPTAPSRFTKVSE